MAPVNAKSATRTDDIETVNSSSDVGTNAEKREAHEVFKLTQNGVDFRTVSWQRATIVFLKIQFAMSILSTPGALATLGAVGGALSIVGWDALNTCRWRRSGESDIRIRERVVDSTLTLHCRHGDHSWSLPQQTPRVPHPG